MNRPQSELGEWKRTTAHLANCHSGDSTLLKKEIKSKVKKPILQLPDLENYLAFLSKQASKCWEIFIAQEQDTHLPET